MQPTRIDTTCHDNFAYFASHTSAIHLSIHTCHATKNYNWTCHVFDSRKDGGFAIRQKHFWYFDDDDSKPFVEARENLFAFYIRKRKKKEMFININFHRFGILNLHIFQAKILK